MSANEEHIVVVTREMADAAIAEMVTPEFLAMLDAMTDDEIAAQIASNPDAAPELDDEWFARARPGIRNPPAQAAE